MQEPITIHLGQGCGESVIRYVDEDVLVLDKPAGVLSAPDHTADGQRYVGQLLRDRAQGASWCPPSNDPEALVNAHRLDRDTSGLMVFAWNRSALAALLRQFRARTIVKTYQAIVEGVLSSDDLAIDTPVIPDRSRPGRSRTGRSGGPHALSRFRVLERFQRHTHIECIIETGRHHQIRVHARSIGHPLAGDRDYGGSPILLSHLKRGFKPPSEGERPLLARQALHSSGLRFIHPRSGVMVEIISPLPRDMQAALKQLRKLIH